MSGNNSGEEKKANNVNKVFLFSFSYFWRKNVIHWYFNIKKLKCDLTWIINFSDKYNQRRICIASCRIESIESKGRMKSEVLFQESACFLVYIMLKKQFTKRFRYSFTPPLTTFQWTRTYIYVSSQLFRVKFWKKMEAIFFFCQNSKV